MQVERASLDSERTVIGADRAEVQAMRRVSPLNGKLSRSGSKCSRGARPSWPRRSSASPPNGSDYTPTGRPSWRSPKTCSVDKRNSPTSCAARSKRRSRSIGTPRNGLAGERTGGERKNLKAEWTKIEAARAKASEVKQRLTAERSDLRQLKEELHRMRFEIATSEQTPQLEIDMVADPLSDDAIEIPVELHAATPGDFDVLETTQHNKVFATERCGDASS